MSKIGVKFVDGGRVFTVDTDLDVGIGNKIVVESVRGLELATACVPCGEKTSDEVKSIVRIATDDDFKTAESLKAQAPKVIKITSELIEKYKLDMKLVDVSFTLDGTKVIINYVCEDRVDFRDLVKDLASQLHLRIELRQIGIRDQAKILGGIGFCGKECCCKKYLNDFDKVSIKMAKAQGLSLNPTKISGICGRLMCCLAYENDFYSEISSIMPKLNSKVKTKDGVGTVVYNNLLKQKVTVRIENDGEIKISEYDVSDIQVLPRENAPEKPKNGGTVSGKPTFEDKNSGVNPAKSQATQNEFENAKNHKDGQGNFKKKFRHKNKKSK